MCHNVTYVLPPGVIKDGCLRLQENEAIILDRAIAKKDTCFNVGPDNIASYIKVDPNKLALKRERENWR